MLNESNESKSTDKKPLIELRNLIITHDGETVEFINRKFVDELSAEVRLLNSRNSFLKNELLFKEERIAFLIQQASKKL